MAKLCDAAVFCEFAAAIPKSLTMPIDFLALAPISLRNNRKRRYRGEEMCLPMSVFAPADQERIHGLYRFLENLYRVFPDGANCDESVRALAALATPAAVTAVLRETKQLGSDSAASNPDELFGKTVHDLRSGGLSLLFSRLQLAQMEGWTLEDARLVFFLTRDHLKIMRSALLGLDDEKRANDLKPKLHGTGLLVEKWHNATLIGGKNPTQLKVDSQFDGHISESCVEFGALDRILYNLINNACRHAADRTICLTILSLPNEHEEDLRFVLANSLSPADRARLAHQDMKALFNPGVSSTSSGLGMTVVADFVSNAYGVISRERALDAGYVGAKVEGDQFIAWFHWPIARDI